MKTVRVYWELTAIMAMITVGLIFGKSFLIKWGLYLPFSTLADCILAFSLISLYVDWRSSSKKRKKGQP